MGNQNAVTVDMSFTSILFTDLDNTIYNWIDFFAPCFRAMIHILSRNTDVDEDSLYLQFKAVYAEKGSVEYPFSIQNLEMCKTLSSERVERLAYLGQMAFGRARRRHLCPYDGVVEGLEWCKRHQVAVVGTTNSPLYIARQRINTLGLSSLFFGLAAAESFVVPSDDLFMQRFKGKPVQDEKVRTWPIPISRLKPLPFMYETVIKELGISTNQVWVIGDSLHKDLSPAEKVGLHTIWARYGQKSQQENMDTLLRITHWSSENIQKTYETIGNPEHVVDDFFDITKIIKTKQLQLF